MADYAAAEIRRQAMDVPRYLKDAGAFAIIDDVGEYMMSKRDMRDMTPFLISDAIYRLTPIDTWSHRVLTFGSSTNVSRFAADTVVVTAFQALYDAVTSGASGKKVLRQFIKTALAMGLVEVAQTWV